MKKLLIALAAVAMIATTQAASVNWTVSDIYKGDTLLSGGVAYVFNNKNSGYANPAALQAALAAAADLDAINTILSKADPLLGGAVTGGKVINSAVDFASTGIPGKTSGVNTFAVIFDTAKVTADSNYYVTTASGNVKTVDPAGTASSSFTVASQAALTQGNAGAWTAVAPEPTSGLLLLLGVAGLALKRKRA